MHKDTDIINDGECIQILHKGKEIVYWDKQEWQDDPDIISSIVNAVRMAAGDEIQVLINLLSKFNQFK